MPIHDWTKVDANLFHDFHQAWTISIRNALNGGLLPNGFSALVDQRAGGVVPDVLTVEAAARRHQPLEGGAVVVASPPRTRHFIQATKAILTDRANRIAICHPLGEVVCIIELVSPGNKSSRAALGKFVSKSVQMLQNGVHLLVIDLFPPSVRDPQGIHKAIWDEIEENTFSLPSNQPLTLAAYVAGDPIAGIMTTAYVEPIAVGAAMPDMPAYLDYDSYVNVPLESTYMQTWGSCPQAMREVVAKSQPPEHQS
jgi:hypothetical protein